MKQCCSCREFKIYDEFHNRGTLGRQAICKECRKRDDRERFLTNPRGHYKIRRTRQREIAGWAASLKADKPCAECNNCFHFSAMQWDHTGSDKEFDISEMVRAGHGKTRILNEIKKCELVCANCHAVRTYQRRLRAVAQG